MKIELLQLVDSGRVCIAPSDPDASVELACMIPAARGEPRSILGKQVKQFRKDSVQRLFLKLGKPGSGKSLLQRVLGDTHIETTFTKALAQARKEVDGDPYFAHTSVYERERSMRLRASQHLADIARIVTSDDLCDSEGRAVSLKMTMEFPGIPARDSEGETVERGEIILNGLSAAIAKFPHVRGRYSGVMLVSDRQVTHTAILERRGRGTQLGGTSKIVEEIDTAIRSDALNRAEAGELQREFHHLRNFNGTVDRDTQMLAAHARNFLRSLGQLSQIHVLVNRYTPYSQIGVNNK